MKFLHIMYTGSYKGGVQKWAKFLPSRPGSEIIHSSFKKGSIADDFLNDGVNYEEFSISLVRSFDHFVLSDLRSIILGAVLNVGTKRKKTAFFVIHTNVRKLFDVQIIIIASIVFKEVKLLLTTQEQKKVFDKHFSNSEVVNLFETFSSAHFNHSRVNQNKNVMYFGKLSFLKQVPLYLRATKKFIDRQCFIFGDGDPGVIREINKYKNFVNFKPGWHNMYKVIAEHRIGYLVVPCKGEGISLATVEAVSFGLIPVCKQKSAFSTLRLPDVVNWKDSLSLNDVIANIEASGKENVYNDCKKAIQEYMKRTKKLSDYIQEG